MTDTLEPTGTPWFLRGNYAPVADEITATDLPVTGTLPPELSGRYLRNGSNPQSGHSNHWWGWECARQYPRRYHLNGIIYSSHHYSNYHCHDCDLHYLMVGLVAMA